jgi:hypothetical protein
MRAFLLLAALLFAGCLQPAAPSPTLAPTAIATLAPTLAPAPAAPPSVVFHTARGNFTLSVEIADEPAEWQRGLMNRTSLAPDAGMLFVFPAEQPRYFWMKDTPLPLDLIFLAGDGRVVNVTANATPCLGGGPCPFYGSGAPARWVVEANAGYAARIGLAVGDRVEVRAGPS